MSTAPATREPGTTPRTPGPRLVRLRRGTLVRARGDGLIQVGSDPVRRALVPDTTSVRGLLHLLEHGLPLDATAALPPVADVLRRAGVLLEPSVSDLLRDARACTRVAVAAPAALRPSVEQLLHLGGLALASTDVADVLLRVSVGTLMPEPPAEGPESDRATLDVSLVDARIRIGPFAVPGRTACVGCLRAHAQDADPWVVQPVTHVPPLPRSSAPGTETTVDEWDDVDPLLVHVALAAAVQDVAAWAEGRQPSSWSATRWVDPTQEVTRQTWERHPHCGCGWDQESDSA